MKCHKKNSHPLKMLPKKIPPIFDQLRIALDIYEISLKTQIFPNNTFLVDFCPGDNCPGEICPGDTCLGDTYPLIHVAISQELWNRS